MICPLRPWTAGMVLVGAFVAVRPAAAQTSPTPTFDVGGRVSMDRLTVVEAGTVRIRLVGTDTVRVDERVGLPPRLVSGQTHRDVTYRFRLAVSPLLRALLPADSLLLGPPRRPDLPSPR